MGVFCFGRGLLAFAVVFALALQVACKGSGANKSSWVQQASESEQELVALTEEPSMPSKKNKEDREEAVFGGGCFWCTEAIFEQIRGVYEVVSGYSGGEVGPPTYEQVVSGKTGHIEVIKISFDPRVVGYEDLLFVFFASHDPTTKDRQGFDVGSQYRSVVFYANDEQRRAALDAIEREQKQYKAPIVTEVREQMPFYKAEAYHQDYYEQNPNKPYCKQIIEPKLRKIKALFRDKIKP